MSNHMWKGLRDGIIRVKSEELWMSIQAIDLVWVYYARRNWETPAENPIEWLMQLSSCLPLKQVLICHFKWEKESDRTRRIVNNIKTYSQTNFCPSKKSNLWLCIYNFDNSREDWSNPWSTRGSTMDCNSLGPRYDSLNYLYAVYRLTIVLDIE